MKNYRAPDTLVDFHTGVDVAALHVWVDILAIPQRNRALQRMAIESLPAFASTCALPLRQDAKWPQWLLIECWAACQFRWTSPPKSQVVSSHNAHLIIEPSTTNWRFSLPSLAVNRLPTTP